MKAALTTLAMGLWLSFAVVPSQAAEGQPLQTVPQVDLSRYTGRWYEIAKFPNWFQKKCVSDTSAQYRLLDAGGVEVLNRCRLADGSFQEALGLARPVGPPGTPKLEVRFAPSWLGFLPFVWGNYWVVDFDADYQLVAVSEPGRDYLWVFARTPPIDATRYQALLARLRAQGLDTDRLELTTHTAIKP